MTKLLLLTAVLFVGCAKANDVGRLEDEVVTTAARYQPSVHELENRANELRKLGKLAPEADSHLREALATISHMKGTLAGTTRGELERTTKDDPELVQKKLDNLERALEEGILDATDHLQTVENWITANEHNPSLAGTPPPPFKAY
jgi:hypothetical protein